MCSVFVLCFNVVQTLFYVMYVRISSYVLCVMSHICESVFLCIFVYLCPNLRNSACCAKFVTNSVIFDIYMLCILTYDHAGAT